MFCCKIFNRILRQVLSLWYPQEPVIYQYIHGKLTVVESISLDETIQRYKIWGSEPKLFTPTEMNAIIDSKLYPPWLWIGASCIFGEVDMTSKMEPYLVDGNTITPSLLSDIYPLMHDWKYLDPVTFKEVDFPEEGITIDAPRVERPTQESQESKDT